MIIIGAAIPSSSIAGSFRIDEDIWMMCLEVWNTSTKTWDVDF